MKATRPLRPATRSRGPDDFRVVGIGASAGGLDACSRLMDALDADCGHGLHPSAEHLDPTHESMLVGLLADHTKMTVIQASDGMRLAPNHLYVIPPGALSVGRRRMPDSIPAVARHGARPAVRFPACIRWPRIAAAAPPAWCCRAPAPTAAWVTRGQADGRPDHRPGSGRGGLRRHAAQRDPDRRRGPDPARPPTSPRHSAAATRRAGPARVPSGPGALNRRPIGCPPSSSFCARGRCTISACTNPAHCNAGSSGVWRWPPFRPAASWAIWRC